MFFAHRMYSTIGSLLSFAFMLAIGGIVYLGAVEASDAQEALNDGISRIIEIRALGSELDLPHDLVEEFEELDGVSGVVRVGRVIDVQSPGFEGVFAAAALTGALDLVGVSPCTGLTNVLVADSSLIGRIGRLVVTNNGDQFSISKRVDLHSWFKQAELFLIQSCPVEKAPDVSRLLIFVDDVDDISPIAEAARVYFRDWRDEWTLRSAEDLVDFRDALASRLIVQRQDRLRATLALFGVVIVIFRMSIATMRRGDFGRQRALGASRPAMGFVNLVESYLSALAGILGATVVSVLIPELGHSDWGISWIAPAGMMLFVTSTVAMLPPLLIAGFVDPVAALRVP